MSTNSFYIFMAIAIGAGCTAVSIPIIIAFCRKFGFYDQPNQQNGGRVGIPRLGGVTFLPSLAMSFLTTILVYASSSDDLRNFHVSAAIMVLGTAVIYLLGMLDDLMDLKPLVKSGVILGVSAFVPFCDLVITNLHGLFGIYEIPYWLGYLFSAVVVMLIVMALKLMDGIDGLLAGFAIIALAIYTYCFMDLRSIVLAVASAGLLGTVAAFFFFNVFGRTVHMKIDMGNSGSLIIGYFLAYLGIKYLLVSEHDIYSDDNPLLITCSIFLVPVLDMLRVVSSRLIAGEPVFQHDKRQIFQLLMSAGLSARQALCVTLALVVGFVILSLLLDQAMVPITVIFLLDTALFIIFFVIVFSIIHHRESLSELVLE